MCDFGIVPSPSQLSNIFYVNSWEGLGKRLCDFAYQLGNFKSKLLIFQKVCEVVVWLICRLWFVLLNVLIDG